MIAALARLSAPPHEQAAYLEEIGTSPSLDELALEFEEAYIPMLGLADEFHLTSEQMNVLRALNDGLRAIGGPENEHLWTTDALERAEWSDIRRLASDAKASLLALPRG